MDSGAYTEGAILPIHPRWRPRVKNKKRPNFWDAKENLVITCTVFIGEYQNTVSLDYLTKCIFESAIS